MEIADINMWKNLQSEPQRTSSSPQIQEAVCRCISSLYLTEILWQATAVSQLEGNGRTYTFGNLTEKSYFILMEK